MIGIKKLFWLIVIIAIIVFGFIWWQKRAPNKVEEKNISGTQPTMPPVDQARLAADYQNSLRALLTEYQQALRSPTSETINNIRQKLLNLKLPAEFRDLHAQLVLLLDKAENSGKSDTIKHLKDLEIIISKYDWVK